MSTTKRSSRFGAAVGTLMVAVTAAWLLVLSESHVFFFVMRPAAPNIHESLFHRRLGHEVYRRG